MKTFISDVSGKVFPMTEMASGHTVIHPVLDLIKADHPEFSETSLLSVGELNGYRQRYIANYLMSESGILSELQKDVMERLKSESTVTDKLDDDQEERTRGQKMADRIARFGGSWAFIASFLGFILVWMLVNVIWLAGKGFDPYPFILLNLILSCIAALQAPVIMMSQNRQEEKDRQRAKKDFVINLKSELEIRLLSEKIDHLVMHQQKELMEIQKMQVDMLEEMMIRLNGK